MCVLLRSISKLGSILVGIIVVGGSFVSSDTCTGGGLPFPVFSRGLLGGEAHSSSSEPQPETDISDCSLSGMEPMLMMGDVPLGKCGLLKGMENVAFVPLPKEDSKVI